MGMGKLTLAVLLAATVSGCTINGVTWDPSRSTPAIAPENLNLTPDEQLIWRDLTDAQRKHAIIYIENGGTLVSSLGAM